MSFRTLFDSKDSLGEWYFSCLKCYEFWDRAGMLLSAETPTLSTFFADSVGETSLLDNNQLPDCAIKSLTSQR